MPDKAKTHEAACLEWNKCTERASSYLAKNAEVLCMQVLLSISRIFSFDTHVYPILANIDLSSMKTREQYLKLIIVCIHSLCTSNNTKFMQI